MNAMMDGPESVDPAGGAGGAELAAADDRDRTYAMLIHLSGFLSYLLGPVAIVVTLAMWLARKDDSAFVDDHGREAMNYSISIWIYTILAGLLMFAVVGCVLLPALIIFDIVVVIMAAVQASSGEYWRYPITIRMIGA